MSMAEGSLFRGFPRVATKLTEWSASVRSRRVHTHATAGDNTFDALLDSGMYSDSLAADLSRLPAAQFAETQLIRYGSIDYLRSIQRPPSGIGIAPILAAKERGRGVIFGCTHIGVFYHALIQAGALGNDLMVVTGNQQYSQEVVDRLCALSGVEIKMITADTKASLAIARQLKRGGVVATMLDLYVDSTLALPVPFFGKPAATPAGIFQLSMATGAPIVPVCVTTGADGGKSVEVDCVIDGAETVMDLATQTNQRIEAMVRRHANTWGVWGSLPKRWRLAKAGRLN